MEIMENHSKKLEKYVCFVIFDVLFASADPELRMLDWLEDDMVSISYEHIVELGVF